jgi:hypothetical protein
MAFSVQRVMLWVLGLTGFAHVGWCRSKVDRALELRASCAPYDLQKN